MRPALNCVFDAVPAKPRKLGLLLAGDPANDYIVDAVLFVVLIVQIRRDAKGYGNREDCEKNVHACLLLLFIYIMYITTTASCFFVEAPTQENLTVRSSVSPFRYTLKITVSPI